MSNVLCLCVLGVTLVLGSLIYCYSLNNPVMMPVIRASCLNPAP